MYMLYNEAYCSYLMVVYAGRYMYQVCSFTLIYSKLRAKLGLKPLEVEESKQEGEEGVEEEGNFDWNSWTPPGIPCSINYDPSAN